MEEEEVVELRRRRWPRRLRRALLLLLVLLLAAMLIVWLLRVRIASDFIDREFARRGVQASYDVKRIGLGTQVFENLVIGDPRRPDLVARRVEVQVLIGWRGPRVGLITARGVRLYGRVVDGRVSWGEVDRLLPPPSDLPFRLPDQRIDVADAALAIDTPAGRLAIGLNGRGNLADGFAGRMALRSHGLALGDCRLAAPAADLAVRVDDLRPSVAGPLAMESLRCGRALSLVRPRGNVAAVLAPGVDSWRGQAGLSADAVQAGPHRMAGAAARLTFQGDAERTAGEVSLETRQAAVDMFRAGTTRFAGRYALSPRDGDVGLDGDVSVEALTVEPGQVRAFAAALDGAGGTPIEPIGRQLGEALRRAATGGATARATLRLTSAGGAGGFRLRDLRLDTASGARLRAVSGEGVTYAWPSGSVRLDGRFALTGGGFPDADFALSQAAPGAPLRGVGRIAPITAGRARLALGEIRFAAGADGLTRFSTVAEMDGPLSGGHVEGLVVPLSGRFGGGGFALGEGCIDARFRHLRIEGLAIGPSRLPLCPIDGAFVARAPGGGLRGGAELRGAALGGTLGGAPILLAAQRMRIDLGRSGFSGTGVSVRLGMPGNFSIFDAESLDGRFVSRGVEGRFAGLDAAIANVPLRVDQGEGAWRVIRGDLSMEGAVRVSDRQAPPRFHPLVSRDFSLTMIDNRIRAGGRLLHPATATLVARAAVEHDLRTGTGHALLDVPGIRFTQGFQPEALTPLTVGVVALVEGTLAGQGRIDWDARGTRSTGSFATEGMNLAAPFGPVEGLTTRIEFTDLLGLVSAPGQLAELDLVRAGIDVYDGRVRYQLQPNYHVRIEEGRWPYAGGELLLEPTLLDFSQPSVKFLTFRVIGLDAARFIQQMEFSNISATGTFDGIIPMRFDQRGGRIIDGRLAARPEGGTLSYVGELSDRDLGPYGILAFNALKSLRYDKFDITLNGALDGEFVTIIDLDGIARDPAGTTLPSGGAITEIIAARVFRQVSRIPFEFNIRIEGQFRALLATARSFSDPTPLIQAVLPGLLREGTDTVTTNTDVQDEESEPVP